MKILESFIVMSLLMCLLYFATKIVFDGECSQSVYRCVRCGVYAYGTACNDCQEEFK